jgi:hypothetical protein
MELQKISEEIREIFEKKKNELELGFVEETHTYFMKDKDGVVTSDWPSVSKVLKKFYTEFPAEQISLRKANGDVVYQQELLNEWKMAGEYATNMGSRVHYILEKRVIESNGNYKGVREPIFIVDEQQTVKSDSMVVAGDKFLELMKSRGAILLDTEMVLGDPDLGYTGQPDKVWLIMNRDKTGFGMVITDWKTNKEKNMRSTQWTKPMKKPFQDYPDTALGHYYLQLPFYGRLILKMLKGTKYDNLNLMGCVIVLLKDNGDFEEFKVPKDVIEKVMNLDMKKYLK